MRTLLICLVALCIVGATGGYCYWTAQRPAGHYLADLRIAVDVNQGTPGDKGNLLGIQPQLYPGDYQSLARLHLKLAAYLQRADRLGLLNAKTVVVLPEHVGSGLWARGEKDELYQASGQHEAHRWLALSNPLPFALAYLRATGKTRLDDALLRMRAPRMAQDYQQLFGGLAREFGITLVAGSIILPEPHVSSGVLRIGDGALFNSSVVFGPAGTPLGQPQRQLTAEFATRGYLAQPSTPTFEVVTTPAGKLGILIGADSLHPSHYRQLDRLGAELIAMPASLAGDGLWHKPWRGFPGLSTPEPISLKPGEVSEGEAWHRLTLTGQSAISQARASVTVFSAGKLWDQLAAGQSFAVTNGQTYSVSDKPGARLINLWL